MICRYVYNHNGIIINFGGKNILYNNYACYIKITLCCSFMTQAHVCEPAELGYAQFIESSNFKYIYIYLLKLKQ